MFQREVGVRMRTVEAMVKEFTDEDEDGDGNWHWYPNLEGAIKSRDEEWKNLILQAYFDSKDPDNIPLPIRKALKELK